MELKDLAGPHTLDAVDRLTEKAGGDDCDTLRFRLDGVVYVAKEDPDDGYRSCMRDLSVVTAEMANVFPAVAVVGRYVEKEQKYHEDCDILELLDAANGKTLLRVGTGNTNDYYPYFVAEWAPENMAANEAAS